MKIAIVHDGVVEEHSFGPGDDCPACHRKVPQERADAATGARRQRVSFTVPTGEEGLIEQLEIAVVEKYQEQWPEDHAAMRDGVGLVVIGASNWRFRVHHFALYATLMVPGLEPTE